MRFRYLTRRLVSAAVLVALAAPAVQAQVQPAGFFPRKAAEECCPPAATAPATMEKKEAAPAQPAQPAQPQAAAPSPAAQAALSPEMGPALGGEGFALASSGVGYIDSAIPRTMVRLRYDAAYDNNRPDRAEFFYPKCGCFATLPPTNPAYDPKAPGPPLPEKKVDYQDYSLYLEGALNNRFSAFIEAPLRSINPEVNANETNIGDTNFGAKYALIADSCQYLTFQFRTFIPTGNASLGLGTNHVSLEPAILFYQQLSDRLRIEAELRDWIPIGGTDFQGNVIRCGIGASYAVIQTDNVRVAPVLEFVGWTVLNGKQATETGDIQTAGGDTIVNGKLGARIDFGNHNSFYAGYGRALTGEVWYKDVIRAEYRLSF